MKNSKAVTSFLDFSVIAFIVLLMMMMLFWGCKHDPIVPPVVVENSNGNGGGNGGGGSGSSGIPCDPDSAYFQNDILPLFISNCAKSGCHDDITHEEDLVLNSYSNIMASGEIVPHDPSEGDIMQAIHETDPDKIMPPPPNTPLTQAQIDMLTLWINQGAQNNLCMGDCDTTNVTYSGTVKPLLQAKCVGCHNTNTTSGNINLSTYAGAQQQALNGRLLATVNHVAGYSPMPKGGTKLPQCEIDELRIWVEAGAPNN